MGLTRSTDGNVGYSRCKYLSILRHFDPGLLLPLDQRPPAHICWQRVSQWCPRVFHPPPNHKPSTWHDNTAITVGRLLPSSAFFSYSLLRVHAWNLSSTSFHHNHNFLHYWPLRVCLQLIATKSDIPYLPCTLQRHQYVLMLPLYPRPHYSRYAPQKPNPIQVPVSSDMRDNVPVGGLRPEPVVDDFSCDDSNVPYSVKRRSSSSRAQVYKRRPRIRVSLTSFKGISNMDGSDGPNTPRKLI